MKITQAINKDYAVLTAITIRSKAFWGYTTAQIEGWRHELTITKEYIDRNQVYVLRHDQQLLGYYALDHITKAKAKIDFLFINPEELGKGYGKQLCTDLIKRAKTMGYETITVDADPNAEAFYKKLGFETVGKLESSIKNRFLPIMELRL